jgi:5'-nucleotidase, C-terminal domain
VLGPDPLTTASGGRAVAALWNDLGVDVVAPGPRDRASQAQARLRTLGLPLVEQQPRIVTADGVRVAFVAVGDDDLATLPARVVESRRHAEVCVVLAAVSRLDGIDSCGADAIIMARYACGMSGDRATQLAGGALLAPYVDGRASAGRLVIEQRGWLRRRVLYSAEIPLMSRAVPLDVSWPAPLLPCLPQPGPELPSVVNRTLGFASPPLEHDQLTYRESALGTYVAGLMRVAADAEVAFVNHRALRRGLAGPLADSSIPAAVPFGNRVCALDLDGKTLKAIFCQNALEDRSYLQSAGAQVDYTPGDPASVRVRIAGEPLDESRTYRVAVVDWLLAAEHYPLLEKRVGRYVGANLQNLLWDDWVAHRAVTPPPAVTSHSQLARGSVAASTVASAVTSTADRLRLPDLAALGRGELAAASKSLRAAVGDPRVRQDAVWYWLGLVGYLEGRSDEAQAAWARAAAYPATAEQAAALLALVRGRRLPQPTGSRSDSRELGSSRGSESADQRAGASRR